jgi:hypothetical protein
MDGSAHPSEFQNLGPFLLWRWRAAAPCLRSRRHIRVTPGQENSCDQQNQTSPILPHA